MQGLNDAKKTALMELIKKLFAAESKDIPEEGMELEVSTDDPDAAEGIMEGLTGEEPELAEEDEMSEEDSRKSFFQKSRKLPPSGKTKSVAAGMAMAPKPRMMAGRR